MFLFFFSFTSILSAPEQETNINPETRGVSAHYLVSLCLLGMKVTATNLTWRDGNLSDTLNNLLMQKLKGLSVSLGGREESRVVNNGTDIQKVFVLQLETNNPQRVEGIAFRVTESLFWTK